MNLSPSVSNLLLRPAFPALQQWGSLAVARAAMGKGVLLGETTVFSTCVHLLSSRQPGYVTILCNHDAGQVFYGRSQRGQIYHLDIFHELGDVDHRRVARSLLTAVERYTREFNVREELQHFIDIQTGTGGGRITGSLDYGTRPSLRAAHRHHIHVACLAWPRHSPLLFYLVAGAEAAIVEQGLELRKIDGLIESRDDGADDIPLDDYSSTSDSWLRGNDAGGSAGAGRGRRGEAASGTGSEPAEPRLTDPDVAAAVVQGAGHRHKAIELAQSLDSPTLAVELLELLAKGARRGDVERKIGSRVGSDALASVLRQLAADGHLRHEGGFMHLTEQGRALLHHFHRYHREIQMALRRAMRRMTRQHLTQPGRSPLAGEVRDTLGVTRRRSVTAPEPGEPLQELAWPETVMAAAARRGLPFQVQGEDLRVRRRVRRRPVDICLLVDASASMCGERMQAAKTLARHLLLSTRDKVAVIVFQERQVRVTVPFTRSAARVEKGLASIRPFGLTPLATGLLHAAAYIQQSRPRNPMLILITDGIPTVPHLGKNPMEDALEAAARWRQLRASFTCIGLQPNERYLSELVQTAGGNLYVVAELEADTLVAIATSEREKLTAAGRH
ncbi:MAG TPA: VWA domain-containing protein [Sphingobacteriaceae bacterium]|nr:VWA domain-containing protein [Sphingobacteriaceae bacterium]